MNKKKLSGSAIFMYIAMVVSAVLAAVCLSLYYTGTVPFESVQWVGITAFMILYHFGLRVGLGALTAYLKLDYYHPFFLEKKFEKNLYKRLCVRKWKGKVLTFDPASYDIKTRTLEQIATTMCKSEVDHWLNELLSITSVLFAFVWGCWPAFVSTAVLAMAFDGQFILIQRCNRPKVMRLIEKQNKGGIPSGR